MMDLRIALPLIAVAGYLIGNFQTGLVVSRMMGTDVRAHGSGGTGATNVMRTLGWLPSALTLAGDMVKGALAAGLGLWLGGVWGARLGGLCAVLGHNWPALFGFRGGKGIATTGGVILALNPIIALSLIACQAAVLLVTHIMSVASLVSAGLYVVLTLMLHWGDWWAIGYAALLGALAFFSHRTNIDRLAHKRENKLNFKEINDISRKKKT
ncbi:glycerol-3-phosphate 1-O-acyltransferase PlsY [Bacillota bacterium Meth-B3]|nr:glycerol-3-phosphate 1-O-acyltransferase PlsY [Christensenellaceae bacterium]MEA5064461.1 glycerol-3-phosphate 1-O-acyltransferase PlsY [Eubacteriales bacterium]